jgi:hypothetical protein
LHTPKKMNPNVNYGAVVDALADAVKEINCAADPTLGATFGAPFGAMFGATLGQAASSAAERGASAQKSDAPGAESPTVVIDFGRYRTKTFVTVDGTHAVLESPVITPEKIALLIMQAESDPSLWVKGESLTSYVDDCVKAARDKYPECNVVLLTRALAYDQETRASMRELIAVLADRGFPGVAIAHPALLVPPPNVKSCLVVDIGEQSTCVTAVHKGRVVHLNGSACGGDTVTSAIRVVGGVGVSPEDAREIKEAFGYVADCADPTLLSASRTVDYTFKTNGRVTVSGTERTLCFEKMLESSRAVGVIAAIKNVTTGLDRKIRDAVCSTVYVVGGTSRAPGLTVRIWNELLAFKLGVRPVVRAVEEERFLPAPFAAIANPEGDFQLSSWGPGSFKLK